MNAALASQLMDEVMQLTPTEFERLVVKLLLAMGYGSEESLRFMGTLNLWSTGITL